MVFRKVIFAAAGRSLVVMSSEISGRCVLYHSRSRRSFRTSSRLRLSFCFSNWRCSTRSSGWRCFLWSASSRCFFFVVTSICCAEYLDDGLDAPPPPTALLTVCVIRATTPPACPLPFLWCLWCLWLLFGAAASLSTSPGAMADDA